MSQTVRGNGADLLTGGLFSPQKICFFLPRAFLYFRLCDLFCCSERDFIYEKIRVNLCFVLVRAGVEQCGGDAVCVDEQSIAVRAV